MNYGREILLGSNELRNDWRGGMSTPDADTRGGVFGPQGYGGGIFDGTSALGTVPDSNATAEDSNSVANGAENGGATLLAIHEGMTEGATLALAIGVFAVIGVGAYFAFKG